MTEFKYVNPHAQLFFDVTDSQGNVTHWSGELLPNPSQLLRNGWTRKRSVEALQYGTKIVVTVAPSRAGGEGCLVLKIEDEKGEELLGGGPNPGGPDPRPATRCRPVATPAPRWRLCHRCHRYVLSKQTISQLPRSGA